MTDNISQRMAAGGNPPERSPRDRRRLAALPTGERFNGRWTRRQWAQASLVASLGMLLAALVPGFSDATRPAPLATGQVTQALALPKLPVSRRQSQPGDSWRLVTVESGQTLGSIFEGMGVPTATMYQLLEQPGAREVLTRLRPGTQCRCTVAGGRCGLVEQDLAGIRIVVDPRVPSAEPHAELSRGCSQRPVRDGSRRPESGARDGARRQLVDTGPGGALDAQVAYEGPFAQRQQLTRPAIRPDDLVQPRPDRVRSGDRGHPRRCAVGRELA